MNQRDTDAPAWGYCIFFDHVFLTDQICLAIYVKDHPVIISTKLF